MRRVPLSAGELQALIEVLLNRQQEDSDTAGQGVASEWMERGGRLDPIGALRKQLHDKELALKEVEEVAAAYQAKLKTLGAETSLERTRSAAARKQLEDTVARQTLELQVPFIDQKIIRFRYCPSGHRTVWNVTWCVSFSALLVLDRR